MHRSLADAALPADANISDVIARNAHLHGDAVAFRFGAAGVHTVTHRDHLKRVEQLAAGLHRAGMEAGDRVSILSKNRIEYVELVGAAARLGAIVSAINWRLSAAEVLAVLAGDDPKIVFAEDEFWALLDPALDRVGSPLEPVAIGHRREGFRGIDELYFDEAAPRVAVDADAALLLIHTAWTEGLPKAAMLSHRSLIAAAQQLHDAWTLRADDVHLCCLPLFHCTAVSLTLATQLAGGSSVLMPKYAADQAVQLIREHRVTLFAEFAPMLDGLLSAGDDVAANLASIRHVCGLDTPQTMARLEATCSEARFWVGYGQTEVSGLATLGRFRDAPGTAGAPLPLCNVTIVDDAGHPLPIGQTGEIVVRGPSVFLGYRGRPEENERAFRSGGLHTGDSGRFDADGRLCYAGRLAVKELIKTGGENVYPSEVEAVLRRHPALLDAVVIGVPDPQWGESIKAICVPVAGSLPTADELIDFVGASIARYKRPRIVVFATALPKRADGSTDRERVRQRHG